jgi:hypothetical protein
MKLSKCVSSLRVRVKYKLCHPINPVIRGLSGEKGYIVAVYNLDDRLHDNILVNVHGVDYWLNNKDIKLIK